MTDPRTTFMGTVAGGGALATVDFHQVSGGNVGEILKLVSAVAIFLMGLFAKDK